jgi:membrane-bound lytic murein transglycosylase D
MHSVNARAAILILVLLARAAIGAEQKQTPSDADDLIQSVQQWAQENLDDSVLEALPQLDRDRVRTFFAALEKQFEGTNIYRLAPLKESASQIIPFLQQYEETAPFAAWLQTRLDYLDVAQQLEKQVTVTPGQPNAELLSRPPPQLERDAWIKTLEKRPLSPVAQKYVPRLKPIFLAQRMPAELVWLAEVESSFDPKARSPAGAAGMFQLMPDTARSQGLSVSLLRDDRFDPDKSARAAVERLRQLHHHFGDWRLALAAYNAGEARVDGLLKKSKTRTFDAIAFRLPAETQMYVPKVEATLHRREGIALDDLKMPRG